MVAHQTLNLRGKGSNPLGSTKFYKHNALIAQGQSFGLLIRRSGFESQWGHNLVFIYNVQDYNICSISSNGLEYITTNDMVGGSNPSWSTIKKLHKILKFLDNISIYNM